MATARQYAYYIEANQIAIIEKDNAATDGLNYTYDPANGLDINTSGGQWKSPIDTITDGLQIEYTVLPKAKDGGEIENESDDIDIPSYLAKALVDYVKAKDAEDAQNIEGKEYFMKEFRKKIEKHENGRMQGIRGVLPGSHAIR
tara:strand:- start:400 stop:831 length:432 start_codon:yes stop_codon:yes gene_type:complete